MTGLVPRAMQFSSPARQVVDVQTALAVVDAVISTKAAAASIVFGCRRFINDTLRWMPLSLQHNRPAKLFFLRWRTIRIVRCRRINLKWMRRCLQVPAARNAICTDQQKQGASRAPCLF